MQVSWIEPEQLRDLVGQLQTPAPAGESIAWEVHTLPESSGGGAASLEIADHDLWLPESPPQILEARDAPAEAAEEMFAPGPAMETSLEESAPHPGEPELDRIRQKLQSIRERAVEAGLLAHVAPTAPALPETTKPNPREQASSDTGAAPADATGVSPTHEQSSLSPEPETRAFISPASLPTSAVAATAPVQSPFALAEECMAVPPPQTSAETSQSSPEPQAIGSEPLFASPQAPSSRLESLCHPPGAPPFEPQPCGLTAAPAHPAADTSQAPQSFEVPLGTITERLNAFAEWASRRLHMADMLVVDDHGDILWGQHDHAGLVVSAMMACTAALRSSALGACELPGLIEQPITADRNLVVLPCPTQYGTINITLVHQGALPPADAALLREALVAAIDVTAARSDGVMQLGSALD